MSTLSRSYRKKGGKRLMSMKKRGGKRPMSMKKRGGKIAMPLIANNEVHREPSNSSLIFNRMTHPNLLPLGDSRRRRRGGGHGLLPPMSGNSDSVSLSPGAKSHLDIDTVGQSLRDANLQLRSEPPNPSVKVSPWNNTTIEPDVMRDPVEIGQ